MKKCQYQQKFGKPLKKDIKDNIDDQPNINFDQSITDISIMKEIKNILLMIRFRLKMKKNLSSITKITSWKM